MCKCVKVQHVVSLSGAVCGVNVEDHSLLGRCSPGSAKLLLTNHSHSSGSERQRLAGQPSFTNGRPVAPTRQR